MDEVSETYEFQEGSDQEEIPFPWIIFSVAAIFDLIGLVPVLNIVSEICAAFVFGLWQKSYVPKTDPFVTLAVAKMIDFASLGFLPSNIGIVVYAYIKKRVISTVKSAPVISKTTTPKQKY